MDKVGDYVDRVLERHGWHRAVLEHMAVELWPEVVGDMMARHTIAQSLRNGTLQVRSRSALWSQELHFHQDRIIARLNGRLKQPLVQKIRCFVTPPPGMRAKALPTHWEDPTFPEVEKVATARAKVADDAAQQKAAEITQTMEDPELRSSMTRLLAAMLRAPEVREARAAQRAARTRDNQATGAREPKSQNEE